MSWWGEPAPQAYCAKPRTVTAFTYDGTPAARATISRWLTSRPSRPAVMRLDHGPRTGPPTLVIEQSGTDPVRLAPGEVLMLRGSRFQGCDRTEFEAAFDPVPREMPIYESGE